ncbi:MAG: hypothetical protein GX590_07045 [Lentisphaerae bacterium]|nr:hypothetical protein [Lentisphaerota bacterium]
MPTRKPFPLPPCGMYIGTGVYPMSKDYLLSTLHAHQAWMPQNTSPLEMIDKIIADNQGNLAQVWGYARGYAPNTYAEWFYALDEIGVEVPPPDWANGRNLVASQCPILKEHADRHGAGILRFIREAAARDIHTLLIYVSARPEWSRRFQEAGKHYLGYDFGERFTFRLDNPVARQVAPHEITLTMLADDLIARVKAHVDERRAGEWGLVMATSCNFYVDYEIAAGTDVPLVEDFAFPNLNVASALSRGLYRQFNLPTWGSHLAHEHYSWLPNRAPRKFDLLRAAMILKYMAGCKILVNESGNWFVEASLCEDSPKFEFPRVPLKPSEVKWGGDAPMKFAPYIAEARKHYGKVDYNAPIPRQYRRVMSEFYDFVKANGTPEGQPESMIALAKGNNDLGSCSYNPNGAIAGAFALADANPAWYAGSPERGWEIAKKVFFPCPHVLAPWQNPFLSGTPFGMVDIVSFVRDLIDADFLLANYKALMFCGWNTSSPQQVETLKRYVAGGGTLFISIPQLSTDARRNHGAFGVEDLVHQGDFSDWCGVRVLGRGPRIYWATAPDGVNGLGFSFPRRFGVLTTSIGEIEITDPAAEVLVVDDEQASPLLLRRRHGKGQVYFLNAWAYPGAFDRDYGPGATIDSPGLIGQVYRHIAAQCRGSAWITDDEVMPGRVCEHIAFSVFPQCGRIYLYNIDFDHPQRFHLHRRHGASEAVELAPSELRTVTL